MIEEKLKFIFDNIQDVIWALDVRTRKFSYISPSIYNLRGITPEEALEEIAIETVTDRSMHVVDGLMDKMLTEYYKTKETELFIGDVEFKTKDGGAVWTEVVLKLSPDENGIVNEVVGVTRDISSRKKAQNALLESEKKFRELSDFLPQTVYELDQDGYVTFVNKAGYELLGFTEEEVKAGTLFCYDFFIPEDIDRMKRNRFNILSDNESVQEFTAVNRNGQKIPVIIYASPIKENGRIIGSRGIIVNISDRKNIEEALRRSEDNLKKVILSLQEGLVVIQDGVFTFLNKSIVRIVGYEVEELLGRSFIDVIAPESKEMVMQYHKKRIAGEPVPNEYEAFLLHKDLKTRIPSILSLVVTEYDGKPAVIGTAKDISERIKNEQKVLERERRLNAILDSALVGIALSGSDGRLIECNSKWLDLFHMTKEEALACTYLDFTYQDDKEKSIQRYNDLINGKLESYQIEKRYVRKDGTVFWGDISVRAIMSECGCVENVVASIFDLTERKAIEEELRNAQEKLKYELQKETIRSQYETLKNQVNPHFLFNSLNVLTSLIRLEPDIAEKFTEQLSKVYRYVLENKDKDIVTLKTELDFLQSYTFLLEIRFKDKLKTIINIPETKYNFFIPTLALQLLIENAIKHNTFSKKSPLNIDIFVDTDNNINVVNNLQFRHSNVESTGVGQKNIKNRYSLLTDKETFFGSCDNKYISKIPLL